ncbi:hypothetical protein [Algirhabdus cladophorae]|uniref:hypothetical protein n=1 Tax=Algirhabdus cladophorae TaxID=3377108 RepID=UPI003B849949
MTVVHRGFDTLTLAVKATIGTSFFETLQEAKDRAEKERRDVQVDYRGITFLLKPHGGAGYAFIASGGKDGANWAFKKPNAKDPWGIRVTFGSFFLAMYGLGAAKAHLDETLGSLGIRFAAKDISIGRADYCVDICANEFALEPDNFVMHSKTD